MRNIAASSRASRCALSPGYIALRRAHREPRAVIGHDGESQPRVEPLRWVALEHQQLDRAPVCFRQLQQCADHRRADAAVALGGDKLDVAQKDLAPVPREADAADVARDRTAPY